MRHELTTGQVACECHAAEYGLPCGHVGAVLCEVAQRGWDASVWVEASAYVYVEGD